MSRFFSARHAKLEAYTPGEQPRDAQYIKLNTNESPFPPAPSVVEAAAREAGKLQLYSDPESADLTRAVADLYGVSPDQVLMTNGSDEILNFAVMAFGDEGRTFAFPDISYGFYPVFAKLNRVPYTEIPLKEDFSVDYKDYCGRNQNIIIANPNAPTGLLITVDQIAEICRTNPNHVVVIDEAYADFSGVTCLPLLEQYDNLLITRTFSKSYSMAGGRLGFGIGSKELIADLITMKYSTNPYNVNRMSGAAGLAAVQNNDYYMNNCKVICSNRDYTTEQLQKLGFEVLPSSSNFIFARKSGFTGEQLYTGLRQRGVLVRFFAKPRIADFVRITIGTREQMDAMLTAMREITREA